MLYPAVNVSTLSTDWWYAFAQLRRAVSQKLQQGPGAAITANQKWLQLRSKKVRLTDRQNFDSPLEGPSGNARAFLIAGNLKSQWVMFKSEVWSRPKSWWNGQTVVHCLGSYCLAKNNLSPKFLLLSDFLQFIDSSQFTALQCYCFKGPATIHPNYHYKQNRWEFITIWDMTGSQML